jgi:hypothetical protein
MKSIMKKMVMVIMIALFAFFITMSQPRHTSYGQLLLNGSQQHKHESLPNLVLPPDTYISYTTFRNTIAPNSASINAINLATWDKVIRFDSAEELYRFSIDVSYNLTYTQFETKLTQAAIDKLMSLHYVLGRDIDYSVMKSKQFNPIGYDFSIEGVHYQKAFKGIFDGNGFEISNLYFSGYQQLTEILYEGTEIETDVAYTEYYSMFAYNQGTIRNLGIINPTFEFNFENSVLYRASNLVGKNMTGGHVSHVYVIDTRPTALVSGIRMVASQGLASGVLFDNYGTFENAYFAARVVMNASYGSRFNVQPVLYQNHTGGTYAHLAFDDTLYQESVTVGGSSYAITTPNALATSMTTTQLRSSNLVLGSGWYYYPAENNPTPKYPSILGLELSTTPIQITIDQETNETITLNQYFIIENAIDLITFSKILNYTRPSGQTPYRELNYVITAPIDMSEVSANSYITPSVEFSGTLAGINNEVYVYKLELINGFATDSYYSGLFSILLGHVYNLIFTHASIKLTETNDFAGVPNFVGLIAADLRGGTIRNVLVDVDIDLGHQTLGEMHVGGIIGRGYGLLQNVYAEGLLDAKQDHVYRNDILINPNYQFGGIAGSTSSVLPLTIYDAYNNMNILGIGTTSTQMQVSQAPTLRMGGIIGHVIHSATAKHTLGLLTNAGKLTVYEMKSQHVETQYVGGVIGMSSGLSYEMNEFTGIYVNKGEIDVLARATNVVVASGILVSNHSQPTEYVHLYNHEDAKFTYYVDQAGVITGNFVNLNYTSLVYNVGQGVTLSQSRNKAPIDLYGATNYSGVYLSTNDAPSLLRFVTNEGNITLKNQTIAATTRIAGISLSENVNYLNVTYNGEISVYNVVMQTAGSVHKELFVSGITHMLTQGYWIKNGFVDGRISLGGITTNTSNQTPRNNIYVGGFVIYNRSGNMDPNGNLAMPKATMGIINSINSSHLTSSYNLAHRGIIGHANLFAGGIATFNDGDIQDSANLGDIRFENLSNVDTANVTFSTALSTGGAAIKIRYGVIVGGISSGVLSAKSRIYDNVNNATIIALSRNFSRAGGILASAAFLELEVANIELFYTTSNNNIRNSILSNTINYGDVSALTITISTYTNSNTNQSVSNIRYDATQPVIWSGTSTVTVSTRTSTNERPGISAAAGGVIGYGLSVMRRMVNHGQISSTDVAGGVVGATFVLTTEYVKIDTAINYGKVRAFNLGTSNSNFLNVDIMDYETIRESFYDVTSTFIFPETRSDIRLFPEAKRGFGGIFGRLQRAQSIVMYGNGSQGSFFNFIVNMDPNVDLIGRLDQVYNYTSSVSFFDFTNSIYYSARKNDTTQAVFTGYSYFTRSGTSSNITRRVHNIQIQSRKYEYSYNSVTNQWTRTTYQRTMARTEVRETGTLFTKVGSASATSQTNQTVIISRSEMPSHGGAGWSIVAGSSVVVGTSAQYKYVYDLPLYNQVWDVEATKVDVSIASTTTITTSASFFAETLPVPVITEEAVDLAGQYVYSPTFEMQTNPTLQQYIYFAENGNLSETFVNSRPNGMYVLATSSGSTFGSILPANIQFNKLLPLQSSDPNKLVPYDVDYEEGGRILASSEQTYQDLLIEYQKLFQTLYSDKSQLLNQSATTIKLKELNGSNTRLLNPTFVQPASITQRGVITFELNTATLQFIGGVAQVNYEVIDPSLPLNAVLAKTIEEYYGLPYGSDFSAYIDDFQILLNQFADPHIPDHEKPDLKPLFSRTFVQGSIQTGIQTIGYFRVYSEVSQNFSSFINQSYYTDYEVRLNVVHNPSAVLPYANQYQIDGGTVRTGVPANITVQQVATSLRFNFLDPSLTLPIGTDILYLGNDFGENVVLEYFDPATSSYVPVDFSDFSVTSILSTGATNRPFSFTLFVNPQLKAGQYRVGYNVVPYETAKTYHTFTKASSTLRVVTDISHYSSGVITPSGTTITSSVNFGYGFDFSSNVPVPIINPDAKPYQSEVLGYSLPWLTNFKISEFATITNVTINPMTYTAQGYRRYTIVYSVRSESGTTTNYTHTITERSISIIEVYRNNNKVTMSQLNPVVVSRESLFTTVSINFGIDPTYSSDIYNTIDENPNAYFQITPNEVEGITLSTTNNYLVFEVDALAAAGTYSFVVTYHRSGDNPIQLGTVYIRKSQGTNAYLIDIQFAELATETNYATIRVSDANGNPIFSPYNPSIYYAGIDYDNANLNGVTQFRVDGQVSNIPLDSYIPYFLNYLPLGATIARKLPGGTYTVGVSGPDDPNIHVLATDFTSQEGIEEGDDIIITYRVTSEDGNFHVYYHITVTDITYNVSYIFEVVYVGNALKPTLNQEVIIINVRNMQTNLPVTDTIVTVLPQFSQVIQYTNSTNLFFKLGHENYRFRFGRNKSGFFSFNVKVLDLEGYLYDVKIELNGTDELSSVNEYDLNSSDQGKYYYINSSTKNRTRYFTITISNARERSRDYGFTDQDASWKRTIED